MPVAKKTIAPKQEEKADATEVKADASEVKAEATEIKAEATKVKDEVTKNAVQVPEKTEDLWLRMISNTRKMKNKLRKI